MTNHWNDIANADVIFVIGSNVAENHPMAFRWVTKAQEKGAKLVNVDPRYTRTSAKADVYAKMRSGTDIAFIDGLINYVIQNELYHKEYVVEYTNAAFLIDPKFREAGGCKDGLFPGFNAETQAYNKATWNYQLDEKGIPKRDPTLKDPNCVFQLMKQHFSRYDADTVCKITGTPKEDFLAVCETYGSTGAVGKVGTILYAMGTTQHTYGTQNVQSYAVLQLLLGNIGLAGGGINAMRGESNVQGSTDYALLYHILPGYLSAPVAADTTLAKYMERITPTTKDPKSANWQSNYPKYVVSLLKAWYGDAATKDNEFGYQWLPKGSANYSWLPLFEAMYAGTIKGLVCWGQNPAVGGPNVGMERKALEKLDWLVAVDLWETETASFWKAPGVDPSKINTEVFLLPAAASMEKEGSISNSGRWMQWRYKAGNPPGEAEDDLWIANKLMLKLKQMYAQEGGPNAEAITKLTWNYGDPPDPHKVAKEINGYDLATGKLMAGFANLKDDGTTSSGNWIYCASYTEDGNMAARREPVDPSGIGLYPRWAWSWPVNRRIVYNRASVDNTGKPFDEKRAVIKWDAEGKKWVGDVPDGAWEPGARYPFIMRNEGVARLFAPGLADGPFPEHYEPWESPVKNAISKTESNPVSKVWKTAFGVKGDASKYPFVATTYRVSEHWQAGAMSRNLPWLVEAMPDMFVEIGTELAAEKGIKNGDQVIVESARGQIQAVAIVTNRLQPFQVNGSKVHEIGLPWHWGFAGIATGDSGNMLTPHIGDANTMMPEYKAFLCNLRKA